MSARSYLSIGDVLTLLRQEFPDVTISKIRFLESQGLVNPERTPSGYRKFYEHDVERLRWVLRQQRENFLPLKVIKDRLDDEQAERVSTGPSDGEASVVEEPVLVGQRTTGTHRASAGRGGRAGAVAARPAGTDGEVRSDGAPAVDGVTLPGIEVEAPAPNGSPAGVEAPGNGSKPTKPGAHAPAVPPPGSDVHRLGPAVPAGPDTTASTPPSRSPSRSGGPAAEPTGAAGNSSEPGAAGGRSTAAADEPAGRPATPSVAPAGVEVREPVAAPPAGRSAATLSIDQVATGSGLDVAVVEQLVEYGLVVRTSVAGLDCFDEEAVAVATLAAGFARFGIEPRHLRLYKNAADREAGFIEQIVLPLIRQRNPDARVRANETADELARLGQQLRASLVRSALGGLLDG